MDTSTPQEAEPIATDVRYTIMTSHDHNQYDHCRTRKSRSAISLVPRSVAKKPDTNRSNQNAESKEDDKPMSNEDFRKLLEN